MTGSDHRGASTDAHWSTEYVMNNYGARSLTLSHGEGVYLFDVEGGKYLDFTAGIAVCNLGHAHPLVVQAVTEQARQLIHCSNLYGHPQQYRLAQRLVELSGLGRAFFCNSGAEANEAAIKLARKYFSVAGAGDRTQIISLPGGFHGRTYGALSVTGQAKYHDGFAPLLPDCLTPGSYRDAVNAISNRTAAVFAEVIQGEGGVRPVPDEVLCALADRCQATGTLFVVDEVQTGIGRTGEVFAFQRLGLKPDIVTLAKGLANGIPVGVVLAREQVANALTPGSHGSTFGGNPLAMAVANRVLDVVTADGFLPHISRVGAYLEQVLQRFGTEVSGRGLMWGMTVPDARQFVADALQCGVLLTAVSDTRVRLVPPLVIEESHVDELAQRLSPLAASHTTT